MEGFTGFLWKYFRKFLILVILKHIVVRTAKPVNLRAGDWRLNGIGRNVSHSFGYGLLDAGAMVRLAKVWRNVPKSKKCRAIYPNPYKFVSLNL